MRRYKSGQIGETVKYWIPDGKPPRSARRLKSDIRKQESNERAAVRTVARLIHANFQGGEDILLGLDYSDTGHMKLTAGEDCGDAADVDNVRDAAQHQVKLFLRRVRRACDAVGVPFRYLAFTSDVDGATGEAVRVHHHLIVNAEALDICRKKWKLGGVDFESLREQEDQTSLAEYLMKQTRRQPDASKYIYSKNLDRPKPLDTVSGGGELAVPRGATLLYRGPYRPGQPQYIRYLMPKRGGGKKKRKDVNKCSTGNARTAGRTSTRASGAIAGTKKKRPMVKHTPQAARRKRD